MDPISLIASVATLLEVGMRVSREMDGVIKTWSTATPVIFAIYNEVSDLNVVLDHMSHAWATVRDGPDGESKYQQQFLEAFNAGLEQAEALLEQLEKMVVELKGLGSLKRKYQWLKKNTVAAELQGRLRDVRMRLTELLITFNVSSLTRIELQLKEVHATMQRNHAATVARLDTGAPVIQTLQQLVFYQQVATPNAQNTDVVGKSKTGKKAPSSLEVASAGLRGVFPDRSQPQQPAPEVQFGPTLPTGDRQQQQHQQASSSVRFVARPKRDICTADCHCRCHAPDNQQSIRLRSGLFGQLFVGYSGLPGLSRSCSEPRCRSRGRSSVEVSYVFPTWFVWFAVSAFVTRTATGGPNVGLFVTKRVPFEPGNILFATYIGDTAEMERLVRLDPFCVHYASAADGRTAMHFACYKKDYKGIQYLLGHGADPDVVDDTGITVREHVALCSFFPAKRGVSDSAWTADDVARLVPVGRLIQDLPYISKVLTGICRGDLAKLLARDTPATREMVSTPDELGYYPLFWAIARNNAAVVRLLLKAGAPVDRGMSKGGAATPLYAALGRQGMKEEIFEELIAAGADIHATDGGGWETFHGACQIGDVAAMRRLVELGADPNVLTRHEEAYPGSLIGAQHDELGVLEFLAEIGADLELPSATGETPLLNSVLNNSHRCMRFLLARGVGHLDVTSTEGIGMMHAAAHAADLETMEILAEARLPGLDLAARSKAGLTPQQIFEQRDSGSEELRRAWERLVESAETANRGENHAEEESGSGVEPERRSVGLGKRNSDLKAKSHTEPSVAVAEVEELSDEDGDDVFYDAADKLALEAGYPAVVHIEVA